MRPLVDSTLVGEAGVVLPPADPAAGILVLGVGNLLMGDEGVGVHAVRALKDLLRERAARGFGVLVSTHLLEVAERLCDRVVIIHHGRKRAEGTPAALLAGKGGATLEDVFLALTAEPAP